MLATLEKNQNDYIARFERHLKYPLEHVWSMLTVNDKLSKWFSELSIEELKEGGKVKFDFGNGTFEELDIIEVKRCSVLEYTWWDDRIRFELFHEPGGCCLVLIERIKSITD
ncbi:MAG: SRPBCC domain-containing protein, partial [Lacrimispora sphenoides]